MDLNEYLRDLQYLVDTDSGSDDIEGLNKMAEFFAERFKSLGWGVRRINLSPNTGDVVICTNREADHYDLMLVGHFDTVFSHGQCAEHPFRIEGDRVYGLGSCDMKHGALLIYYLMKELPKEINDKLNIVAVFNPDEETGSKYSRTVYSDYAKKSDLALIYEASGTDGARCIERKGATGFTVNFTGIPGHSGYVFMNGAKSAISEMARWIVRLDALQSKERNTTVNVGVVSGGTKQNVVAEHASMRVGIRYSIPGELDRVEETLAELTKEANERGIKIEITEKTKKEPLVPTEEGRSYFAHLGELLEKKGIPCIFRARGGLSDANIIGALGPICIDGMGPSGDFCHSVEECMDIDSVIPAFNYSNIIFSDIAERKIKK